jgi:hypothetical protein
MDKNLYHRIIAEMHADGVEELGLFYLGESFLVKWLPEAIRYAKEVGFPYVFLTTNGSLATAKRTAACFNAGLDSLKFSFNYSDKEQFEAVANVKGSLWEAVYQNILDARVERDHVEALTGHRCGLYASYIQYDGEQGDRMAKAIDWIRELVDEVYALPLYNQAGLCANKLSAEHEDWTQTAGNMGRLESLVPPLPCWAVLAEGHITYNGKLSACCFDHDGRFHMADLNEVGFMEGWNSQKFQDLRAAHLDRDVSGTVCARCVAWQ